MVSVSPRCVVCGMAVACAAGLPSACSPGPCPAHPSAVLISTAVVSCYCSLPGVWCVGVCLSVVFVWWGILCLPPPLVMVGGGIVDGGVALCGRGGVVMEGRVL